MISIILQQEYTKKTGQHAEKKLKNFDSLMKPLEPEQEEDELTVVVEPQRKGERKLERKTSVVRDKKKDSKRKGGWSDILVLRQLLLR